MKFKSINMIEVGDWDKLVIDTYNRPYSFQQQDDCKDRGIFEFSVPDNYPDDYENDTVPEIVNDPEMGVSFKAWLARAPEQKLPIKGGYGIDFTNMWWERNFYPDVSMIINDLHAKGLLEAGNYAINIDW